jgi:membrane protease YdiL (CAAX protease family)
VLPMRAASATVVACLVSLLLAAPAWALDNGEGVYGKTDDKVITNFGFALMIFFTVLVVGLSLAQHLLGKRKGPK